MKTSVTLLLCLRFFATSGQDTHDHHDHGDHGDSNYEWAGIFETPEDAYTWIAQKVDGDYADPKMKMVILPVQAGGDMKMLAASKTEADHGFGTTCVEVESGGEIVPEEDKCYDLHFDQGSSESRFTIKANGIAGVAIFTEHFPTEFENTDHYLKDRAGIDIEPLEQLPAGFEWAGIFDTPEDTYMWTAQKVEGDYADPKMKMVMLSVPAGGDHTKLEALREEAVHGFETNCIAVNHGEEILPMEDACYSLVFHPDLWQSIFTVKTKNIAGVAIFAEHFPTEFENTAHYLKDKTGEDIEPLGEIPEAVEKTPWVAPVWKEWGEVIGASLLVNIMTLIGVVLAVPAFKKAMIANEAAFASLLGGFCGGAIMACAFFLLLLEASHYFNEWTEEVDVTWRWGTSVVSGFFFPTVVQVLTSVLVGGSGLESSNAQQQDVEATQIKAEKEDLTARARLFAAVIIGDGSHNLCDGFFIAAAFKACGPSFGWTAALSSILHEIPQELADYSLLTGTLGRLPAWKALVFNFLSGITVMIGAMIVTEIDVGNTGIGVILAFGGGVYLHVAAVECVPKMYEKSLSKRVRLLSMAMFVLGAVVIGLVLLKHEHCSPPTDPGADPAEAAADPHAGHNH